MYIPVPESSRKYPLQFFQSFFNSDSIIEKSKSSFFPDPENYTDFRCKYPLTIDKEKESYIIEIPTFEAIFNNDDGSYYEIQNGSESKTYQFEVELNKELKIEYLKSKALIDEIINSAGTIEEAKLKIQIWLDLLSIWEAEIPKMAVYKRYKECIRPVHALIRHLYKTYWSFCPKLTSNFKSILKGPSVQQQTFEEKPSLAKLFFKELVSLEDDKGEAIIEFGTGPHEIEMSKKAKLLEQLYNGVYSSSDGTINFQWGQEAICYLFSRFREFDSPINLRGLERAQKIKIKNQFYNANNADKNNFSFRNKNTSHKRLIDDLFEKHEK